jgi:SAM-dependent methyltransferase
VAPVTEKATAPVDRGQRIFEGAFGPLYASYISRPPLARLIGRIVWGGDVRPLYGSMRRIAEVPPGGLIVDAPCGGGVAFRGLSPKHDVRYVAVDLSARMLEIARVEADRRALRQIEFVHADATAIPVESGTADLFLSLFGLHCFPEPGVAIREVARCLRPGGQVEGGMIASGPSRRQRLLVRSGHGGFGSGGTVNDLRRWLGDAGLEAVRVAESGCFAYFSATMVR